MDVLVLSSASVTSHAASADDVDALKCDDDDKQDVMMLPRKYVASAQKRRG